MVEHPSGNLIAVDGGGTSCRFALILNGARHDVREGPANVTTDFAAAVATLERGILALAASAGVSAASLRHVPGCFALAGVLDEDSAWRVARATGMTSCIVEDDRVAAVVGALGERDGSVFGVGTGSFLARRHAGNVTLLGGWGFLLGDEASGADLGRQLLRRILHTMDGLAEASELTNTVLEELGGTEADIVATATGAKPSWFAQFAPQVVAAARAGDVVGQELMQNGADYLMRSLRTLGWKPGEPLCPVGGLAQCYRTFLPEDAAACLVAPNGSALDGALTLAARYHAESRNG